ncbi:MAG: sialate O-acetylesterase [Kiritimatiellales bacterium]|jgi:sialate O-acetylesterase
MRRLILLVPALFCSLAVFADVKPAGVFTDDAVLQQGEPVRIWGTASAGEKVTVKFAGQTQGAAADKDGKWMVTLEKMPVCAEGRPLVFQGSETAQPVELKNVVVGEVWLAGGQSNMETPMSFYKPATQADIDSANDPLLRMVTIPRYNMGWKNTARPEWKITTPQNADGFSASAYYFAKNLRQALNVPVGIVRCAVGGSPAAAWMSRKTFESNPELKKILDAYEAGYKADFANDASYEKALEDFEQASKEWRKTRKGQPPVEPMGPKHGRHPCGWYETMLTQTIPYTVKGVIWYQGETDADAPDGFHYRTVFPALIQQWREEFRNPELPFLFVQLATLNPNDPGPDWPELRESQSWTEEHIKHTGMAVIVDGGEEHNIHPPSKPAVGCRLSLLARNMVYGEKSLICRGPRFEKMTIGKGAVVLTFKDTGSGLVLKPETNSAFEVCGKDGNYVPAKAVLADGKITVSAENVKDPQNVRYGWKKWFVPTLFNAEGLPASPFRTDDFPPVTKDRYYLDRI